MNFTQLIFALYRNDEITFGADGKYHLSWIASADIQRHIAPDSIFDFDLLDTFAGQAIKKEHDAIQKRSAVRLVDCRDCAGIKSALFDTYQRNQRVHYEH